MLKRIAIGAGVAFALLLAILIGRALSVTSLQVEAAAPVDLTIDEAATAERFAAALRFRTVSNRDPERVDPAPFLDLHAHLEATYPAVHATLARETVNELSLLYTWPGSDPGLAPAVLMGHLDVVPVAPGTEPDWTHPPWSGAIVDGEIWGRGALDDKSSVISILEAVERLVTDGHVPRRTIYLAFGHDEEVGGPRGAARIAETLEARGASDYAIVLDEGGGISRGMLPGIDRPTAVIGIAEKGFLSLELAVEAEGGHSSAPPPSTAIGILSAAIENLESNPFPARLDGAMEALFSTLAPEMPFLPRLALANLWLTRPILVRAMLLEPRTAAGVRTTTAVTMFDGGVADNVLPPQATAVVNFRILPGDTRASVTERVRSVVDDSRISIRDVSASQEPSATSEPWSPAFRMLATTLSQVMPDENTLAAPFLVMGGTDAKYYSSRSRNVFRFLPVVMPPDALAMVHGTNERIDVAGLAGAVRFMHQLILNLDHLDPTL